MKHQITVMIAALVVSGCNGSMPFQGFSTANYVYHPPAVMYATNVTQGGYPGSVPYRPGGSDYAPIPPAPYGYMNGGGYSSVYTAGSVYPENAFRSFAESTSNLRDASRDIKGIYNIFGGGKNNKYYYW